MTSMTNDQTPSAPHKNKAFATLLGLLFGGIGLHRFYLRGLKDRWGWLHMTSLVLSAALLSDDATRPLLINTAPLVLSVLIACIVTFVIGLMPDEKWDALYNANSARKSDTGWPVPLMMVINLGYGATLLLIALARGFDLMLTGGAYG